MSDPMATFDYFGYSEQTLSDNGWTAEEIAILKDLLASINLADYDYADNERLARKRIPSEVDEYERIRQNGCCGVFDEERNGVLFGFNWGH